MNFAENLLYPKSNPDPNSPAIISVTESSSREITWHELRAQVKELAAAMKYHGLQPHDRVAGFLGNHSDTVVAMLATTSLGALVSRSLPLSSHISRAILHQNLLETFSNLLILLISIILKRER